MVHDKSFKTNVEKWHQPPSISQDGFLILES
jgi:hypothetical protein